MKKILLGFVAQGSESGFGKRYARGINDNALKIGEDKYIQIVSVTRILYQLLLIH